MPTLREELDTLKTLVTPEDGLQDLQRLADQGHSPAEPPKVNGHIHLPPNFSAFDSVTQAVYLAAEQKLGMLGVSNYYDFTVYADFLSAVRQAGVFPLMGLEIICMLDDLRQAGVKINDPGNPGKMYICGKGITRLDPLSSRASELIGTIRRNDDARMTEMVDRLGRHFASRGLDLRLDTEAVVSRVVARHGSPRQTVTLQERHIAQAFQERFFEDVPAGDRIAKLSEVLGTESKATPDAAVTIQGEIRSHLMKADKPCFVEEAFVRFAEAKELILELGGIPCYPTLADGKTPICPFETPVDQLIGNLRERGIHCAEFIPVRNQPQVLNEYVTKMREAGILVTAGTEHNTLDLIPLEPACAGGCNVPPECVEIFREGAYVTAAHQVLSLHGQTGYVDAAGELNDAWDSQEERIASLAALGAAAVAEYHGATVKD
ncbi:MAG: hypothetical protein ACLFV7_07950 [Phycisphaerae bacterium]